LPTSALRALLWWEDSTWENRKKMIEILERAKWTLPEGCVDR
jgi:hypothetical protein